MRKLWFVWLLVFGVAAAGCGDDDEFNNSNFGPSSNSSRDVDDEGDADAGNDADDGGTDAGDAAPDADADTDADDPVTDLCEELVELGELSAGSKMRVSELTGEGTTLVEPSCGAEMTNEVVFEFSVQEALRIDATIESADVDDWVLTLLDGDCDEPEELRCTEANSGTFIAEAGQTYLLAVEPADVGIEGSFTLELDPSAISCAPIGSTSCDNRGRVVRCETGFNETAYSCAYDCEDGACGGDVCQTAFVVNSSGSHSFSGSYSGYASDFNFNEREGCGHSGAGPATNGQDLVFALPGLEEDDEVIVDASAGDGQYGIFVLEACGTDAACVTGGLEVDDVLEWTVPDAGDYHIVVDLIDESNGNFDITIDR